LELFYLIAFLNVKFFDGTFLDFLSQIGEVKLNDTEVEKRSENSFSSGDLLE